MIRASRSTAPTLKGTPSTAQELEVGAEVATLQLYRDTAGGQRLVEQLDATGESGRKPGA